MKSKRGYRDRNAPSASRGPRPHDRRRTGSRPAARGPKPCPMCGAIVADLAAHIRARHDDAQSHPRE